MTALGSALTHLGLVACALSLACSGGSTDVRVPLATGAASTEVVSPVDVPLKPPPKLRDRYAIASENEQAVEVARAVLDGGGSVVDAAIAGLLVGCAAHAASCGLGGGGAAMFFDPAAGRVTSMEFRETAALGLKRPEHVGKPDPSKRGVQVGVPGLARGLAMLHARGGKLPWRDVWEAAARAVDGGLRRTPYATQTLAWSSTWVAREPAAPALGFTPDGAPAPATDRPTSFHNAALAATYRLVGERGADALYTGEIADDIVASAKAFGGRLTAKDLASYEPMERDALASRYGDATVFTAAPPSGAGCIVLAMLGLLPPSDLGTLPSGSGAFVHVLAEGLRAAYADRATIVGDPAFTKGDARTLFDAKRMAERRAAIKLDKTTMPKLPSISDSGTFQMVVIDAGGHAVVLSASLTSLFGATIMTKHGFVLNDALSDFSRDDYGQRAFTRGPNFPRGRARPVSNLAPTIVVKDGAVALAVGSSGGLRGVTGLVQVLLEHLGRGTSFPEAVIAPRVHVSVGGAVHLESGLAELAADLTGRGEITEVRPSSFSGVLGVAVTRGADGPMLLPAFDARKGGAATVGREEIEP